MKSFIEVTPTYGGKKMLININCIMEVSTGSTSHRSDSLRVDPNSFIILNSNPGAEDCLQEIGVKETYDEVISLIREAQ